MPRIACDEAIGHAKSGRADGYRVVLRVVSVPPAYLPQVVETGEEPWRYWLKAGLVIRAGNRPAVLVSVPKEWRERAAITWASSGTVGVLRVGRCPPPRTAWYAYAGGFLPPLRLGLRAARVSGRAADGNCSLRPRAPLFVKRLTAS